MDVITLSDEEEIIGETNIIGLIVQHLIQKIKTCCMFSQPIDRYQTKTRDNGTDAKNVRKLNMIMVV